MDNKFYEGIEFFLVRIMCRIILNIIEVKNISHNFLTIIKLDASSIQIV